MFWLYIHFPNLQLDRLSMPNKDQMPIAIIDTEKNEVVQKNLLSKELGIENGIGVASAISLCHELRLREYDQQIELNELNLIAEKLYSVVADIALSSSNGLYIKVSSMLKLYPSLQSCWNTIEYILQEFHISYSYAVSYSPKASKLLALSEANKIFFDKTQAVNSLGQLPIRYIELHSKTISSLTKVGIKQISQLLSIPLKELSHRFEYQLVSYIGKLKGEIKHPLIFYQPKNVFTKRLDLLYEVNESSHLIKPIGSLLLSMEQYLKVRNLVCNSIKLIFKQNDFECFEIEVNSVNPQYKTEKWLKLVELKLERLRLTLPIREIRIDAEQLFPITPSHKDIFAKSKSKLTKEELISILEAKLGKLAIYEFNYETNHLPEHSNILTNSSCHSLTPDKLDITSHSLRPLYLFKSPILLTEQVEILSSPERLHTAWWEGSMVSRDYFLSRNHLKQWLWIYRCPNQRWFIHGLFG